MSRNSALWREHAKCAGRGDLFFDDLYEQQAKAICADCPVREQWCVHRSNMASGVVRHRRNAGG